ncbi:hypothetical protein [Paraburkholderia fungorum]|jgi:hypothetical protein|uniref:hypothetical protein n=1 Tax=Paraburkholderia fungorum TaxID=134537 RepID=UPI000D0685AD|nr:hypothetical protein [Paraburkholderia fungorum]PRZ45394.1 hypothetical protein BX589_13973 [Paraburkholderia fungorum]
MDATTYDLKKLKACPQLELGSAIVRNWIYAPNRGVRPNHFWIGFKGNQKSNVYRFGSWKACIEFLDEAGDQQFQELRTFIKGL